MNFILVIGYGYVGKAVDNFFNDSEYTVLILDPFCEKPVGNDIQLSKFVETKDHKIYYNNNYSVDKSEIKMTFICVPTEEKENGECDTSIVEKVLTEIQTELIIIKSTVPPGFTEKMNQRYKKNIIFSPEYIGEGKYDKGKYNFDKKIGEIGYFIFGGNPELTSKVVNMYQKIGGPSKKYIQTDSKSAETSKYMTNSWLATKLTFFYEINQICKINDIDYNKLRELVILDPRLTDSHTCVFYDQKEPFNGKCLPKDTNAIVQESIKKNSKLELLQETLDSCKRLGSF